jgi:hypothetical protein
LQSSQPPPRPFECWIWQEVPQQAVPAQQVEPQASGVAPEHAHTPFEQVRGATQAFPHAPQFWLVASDVHPPLQQASPAPQAFVQVPQ